MLLPNLIYLGFVTVISRLFSFLNVAHQSHIMPPPYGWRL